MRYFEFEFDAYEYTALIGAKTMEKAINCYNDNVDNTNEGIYVGGKPQPKEVTETKAFEYMKEVCTEAEIIECKGMIEALENNDKTINYESVLMLIDIELL